MSPPPAWVGIGCGTISVVHPTTGTRRLVGFAIAPVSDLAREHAEATARDVGSSPVLPPEEALKAPEIELALNLTIPDARAGPTMPRSRQASTPGARSRSPSTPLMASRRTPFSAGAVRPAGARSTRA